MKVIENDLIVYFDVDDTLVMWKDPIYKPQPGAIEIVDKTDGTRVFLTPHHKHIELLKKYKARGYEVKVWSGGGWAWAESVIRTLGLTEFVDEVSSKPIKYVDDLPCQEWMPNRIYLKDE